MKAGNSHTSVVPAKGKNTDEECFVLKLKGKIPELAKPKDQEVEAIRRLSKTNPKAAAVAEQAMVKRKSTIIPNRPCEIEVSMAARIKAGS